MEETNLVETASSWCASHGVLMGARNGGNSNTRADSANPYIYEPAPFSLYPTPFSKSAFDAAFQMARPFHTMVHNVASNTKWLQHAIAVAAQGDAEFTGRLLSLAQDVLTREATTGQTRAQTVVLGIIRSDYMLHGTSLETAIPLQVELNTIASSFGCLSSKITKMHQHLFLQNDDHTLLPDNGADVGIARSISAAMQEYQRQYPASTNVVVVMVVQPGETNSCDQRDLEFMLHIKHGIRLIRRTLAELATATTQPNQELILHDGSTNVVAGVVYYRAGYRPNDYPTEHEWSGRSIVEHSAAIKCPDVFYHLVGAKKIQQVLAQPGVLEVFVAEKHIRQLLRSSFAGLYALGEGDDSHVVAMALNNPNGYVLKPQREGGGNNLYDDELVNALKSMSHNERGAFILMEKIVPPSSEGSLVRGGQIVYKGECVCELGVFSVTLRDYADGRILVDDVVGHILRAKSVTTDEGGVAAGYAFLSSPKLLQS